MTFLNICISWHYVGYKLQNEIRKPIPKGPKRVRNIVYLQNYWQYDAVFIYKQTF